VQLNAVRPFVAGKENYKVRPEKGGFHTNYYRNVFLEGCTESSTNAFLCTHNTDGLRTQCSNDTSLGGSVLPKCPHGGTACCCKSRVLLAFCVEHHCRTVRTFL